MQIRIFTIPVTDRGEAQDEMNRFLRSHRVLEVQTQFVSCETGSCWCFCVKWLQGALHSKNSQKGHRKRIDYRTVLDDENFKTFAVLRECRKQIAREEGIPAYAIFTDEELAGLSKLQTLTIKNMQEVPGIGEKKAERYGKRFIGFLKSQQSGEEQSP